VSGRKQNGVRSLPSSSFLERTLTHPSIDVFDPPAASSSLSSSRQYGDCPVSGCLSRRRGLFSGFSLCPPLASSRFHAFPPPSVRPEHIDRGVCLFPRGCRPPVVPGDGEYTTTATDPDHEAVHPPLASVRSSVVPGSHDYSKNTSIEGCLRSAFRSSLPLHRPVVSFWSRCVPCAAVTQQTAEVSGSVG